MLRRTSACVLALCLTAVAPLAAETVRAKSRLNLRQEPTTDSGRIALLPSGSDLEVISRRGLWIRVKSDAGEGWVHSEYVVSTDLLVEPKPERSLRDAELAREVALLRVEQLEKDLAVLRSQAPAEVGEVEELRTRLAERDRQVAELVDEIATTSAGGKDDARLQSQLDTVSSERDRLAGEVADLETQLGATNAALSAAQLTPPQVTTGIAPEDLAAMTAERDQASEHASRLQTELGAARQALAEAGLDSAGRESEIRTELAGLTADVERLESDLSAERQALAERAETIATLEQRASAGEAATRSAVARAAELEALVLERDQLKSGMEELDRALAAARSTLAERDTTLEATAAEAERARTALQSRVASLEAELGQHEVDLTAARSAMTEGDSTITTLRQQLTSRDAGASQLESDLAAARQSLTSRAQEIEVLERRLAEEADNTEGDSTIATLRQRLASRDIDASQLESELAAARQRLTSRAEEIEVLERRVAEDAGSAVADREAARSRLQAAESESVRLARRTADLEKTLQQRDERISTLERANSPLGDVADLRSQLLLTRQARTALEEQAAGLQAELRTARVARDLSAKEAQAFGVEARRLADALDELQDWSAQAEVVVEQLTADKSGLEKQVEALRDRRSRRQEPGRRDLETVRRRALAAEQSVEALTRELEVARARHAESLAAAQAELTDRLAVARAENAAVEAALLTTRSAVELAESATADATRQTEALLGRLDQAEERERNALAARTTVLGELEAAARRADGLRAEVARLSAVEGGLRARVGELETGVSNAAGQRAELARLSRVESELRARVSALEAPAAESEGLRSEVTRLSGVERGLRARVSELETQAKSAAGQRADIARLSKVEQGLRARVGELEIEVETVVGLRAEMSRRSSIEQGLRSRLRELEAGVAEAGIQRAEVIRLTQVEKSLRARVDELEAGAVTAESRAVEMAHLASAEQGLRSRVKELETQIEAAEGRQAEVARLSAVEQELRARVLELETGLAQADRQSAQVARLSEAKQRLEAQVRDLETQATNGTAWRQRAETSLRELAASRLQTALVKAELEAARTARTRSLVRPASPVAEPESEEDATAIAAGEIPRERLVAPAVPIVAPAADPDVQARPEGLAAVETVKQWAAAWASQDATAYLSFYDAEFAPTDGMARAAWETRRRQRLALPVFIEVELLNFRISPSVSASDNSSGTENTTVSFEQRYRSNTFSDRVRKSLELVKRGAAWKIVSETTE